MKLAKIRAMSERRGAIAQFLHEGGMTYREIGRRLNISMDRARKLARAHRAKRG